jgi:hypothetical protein
MAKIIGNTVGTPIKPQVLVEKTELAEQVSQLSKEIEDIKANGTGSGLTTAQVNALDGMFKKCAYTGDVSAEYEAFKNAFGIGGTEEPEEPDTPDVPVEPTVTLTSISATYSGGDVVVGTSVNSLTGITVVATYSDGSTKNVTGYTLSGTIAEGNNTITVSYGGKTTTFTVVGYVEQEEPEEPSEPVYRLAEATTFDGTGTDAIDTGVKLMTNNDAWSICITTNIGTFNWSRKHILRVAPSNDKELFSYGVAAGGKYNVIIGASSPNVNTTLSYDTVDFKAVIVRTGSVYAKVYYVNDGVVTYVQTNGEASFAPSEHPLIIGTNFNGTVNDMSVYNRVLTEDEIKEYLGVSE